MLSTKALLSNSHPVSSIFKHRTPRINSERLILGMADTYGVSYRQLQNMYVCEQCLPECDAHLCSWVLCLVLTCLMMLAELSTFRG